MTQKAISIRFASINTFPIVTITRQNANYSCSHLTTIDKQWEARTNVISPVTRPRQHHRQFTWWNFQLVLASGQRVWRIHNRISPLGVKSSIQTLQFAGDCSSEIPSWSRSPAATESHRRDRGKIKRESPFIGAPLPVAHSTPSPPGKPGRALWIADCQEHTSEEVPLQDAFGALSGKL